MKLSCSVIIEGPLCLIRERGFPSEPTTVGLCRVLKETPALEAHVSYFWLNFTVLCTWFFVNVPFVLYLCSFMQQRGSLYKNSTTYYGLCKT